MRKNYLKLALLLMLIWSESGAEGIFNLGLMAGVADDTGNIEKTAGDMNTEMREYQRLNAGTAVTEIETTYSPVFSVNAAYINGSLLLKSGWEYSSNIIYNSKGSIQGNNIVIDYSRYTFPVTAAFVLPLTQRDRLYFGGGLNVSYVLMKITQSNPGTLPLYPSDSHTFSGYVSGTHLRIGGETLVSRNYSFVLEFTRFFGNPKRIKSVDENTSTVMGINSFEITAGVNYNIDFKI